MRIKTYPFFIPENKDFGNGVRAKAISLSDSKAQDSFSEDDLQALIYENPEILPVTSFEPYFRQIITVCRELPTAAGPVDNFYVTPEGNLILVECKLWRNPESRRKVVAQIMDYAKEIASWSYEDLMEAINRANKTAVTNPLYDIAAIYPETPDEALFTDQVSRNMRLGRHLLLIVGDGIQEGVEKLADFIQQNMGLQYTLGLLEIGLYTHPVDKGLIVIPNIIAKTTMIERGVLRIEENQIKVLPAQREEGTAAIKSSQIRAGTLSEIEFFEALEKSDPKSPEWLRNFLSEIEKIGMTWEIKRSLLPRYSPDGENEFSFGYFRSNGIYHTANAVWLPKDSKLKPGAEGFVRAVTAMFPGASVTSDYDVLLNGKVLRISNLIGKEEALIDAIRNYIIFIDDQIKSR